MGESTTALRREIDETRQHMTMTVDAIEDRITPGRIIERRRNRMRSGLMGFRDRVMGIPQSVSSSVAEGGSSVRDEAGDLVHGVEARAEANPFAAAVLAFGAGMLAATLFPASDAERQVGAKALDAGEGLREPLTEAAHAVVESAKEHGAEAASAVKDAATSAAEPVRASAQQMAAGSGSQAPATGPGRP